MKYDVLGVAIDNLSLDEAADAIKRMYFSKRPCAVFYCNPETLVYASRDEYFKTILRKGDLLFPDGVGLKLLSWFVGAHIKERIAGIDLLTRVCEISAQLGKSVFLFGGKKGIAEKTAFVLQKTFPGLKIAGTLDGFAGAALWETNEALRAADAIFVGLGAPAQEEWIIQNMQKLPRLRIAMAVGGAFDMLSGATLRAPRFLQKTGLEWLWRFAREPGKRWRRMINAVIVFPIKALWYHIKIQNTKSKCKTF